MATDTAVVYKWQPVMLVIDGRMECEDCGALAVFIICERPDEPKSHADWDVQVLCQACWMRHEQEDEE